MKNKVTALIVIRSVIFWSIVGLAALPYNLTAFLFVFLPVRIRHKIISSWANIFTFFSKYLCGVNYKVTGRENLIKTTSILASNHQSAWETIAFATFLPQHVWILKRELLKIPFFGWTVATLSPIAIDRSQGAAAIQQILTQSVLRVKQGFCILAFPEGTRVKPGVKKPFKVGVAKMATSLDLPIIPISHNAGYCIPRNSFWLYPGLINVIIDKPIYPQKGELAEDLMQRVEAVVSKNLDSITH